MPAGGVISQNPGAGTVLALGSLVNFVVSSGPANVGVPNVVGLTQAAATSAITTAGLVLGTVTRTNRDTVPAGSVISQSPVAGTSVAPGSAIGLTVSVGPSGGTTQPSSLDIVVSEKLVAPDGTIGITPVAKDASGNAITNGSFNFVVSVTPVGLVTGNAPVIQGLNVTFPKLVKRPLNQSPVVDPNGDYADVDPSDPNYGKETGGKYRITVTISGTSISGSQEVLVLPTGTSRISVKAHQYARNLEAVHAAALNAGLNSDLDALAAAKALMQAINSDSDFSFNVLSTTSALAPPNGRLVTPAQLIARGFIAGPQDAQFAASLTALIARIRAVTAQVNAINPAALTQAALDALQAAATAYTQSLQQFQLLQPSVLAITQQGSSINQLLGTELPLLLDAIKGKTTALLARTSTGDLTPKAMYARRCWSGGSRGARGATGDV